ncbi:YhgE/Pip domain-containing protein [Trichococcus alkaliphilus]|uniref:YhgE/Pip domain-containing protein n=1 Tax=Trichococcus alkaliphilus TaxID=2052943 RepID=UPI000D0BC0AA|nr:YhgE/Pip domain-containing protein [Trichococcus alkaliphilus]
MLKQEWKSIFKTKKMLVILFGISLIPSLYTVLFLSSMWDPYGKLAELPVAVVNQDKAVSYNEETLAVGDSLVAGLQESDTLDFDFVSREAADSGLADGSYYMALTIPENFSANATTLLDETPQQMELTYSTSAGRSYIASKLTASAANEIKDTISDEVTAIYAETVFGELKSVAEGMTAAADGSAQLSDGTVQIKEGNEILTTNLETLADSTLTFRDGAETLAVGLQTYLDGVAQLDAGALALNNGAAKLTAAMPALQTGVGKLNDGAVATTEGSASLSTGLSRLATNSLTLSTGMDTLNSGMSQLSEGSASLNAGLAALNTSLTSAEQQAKLTALQSGLDQMKNGIETLDSQLQQSSLSSDLATALSQLDGLATTIASFQTELNTITAAADPVSNTAAIMDSIAQSGTELTPEQEAAVSQAVSAQLAIIANEQAGSIQTITNGLNSLSELSEIEASAIGQQVATLKSSVSSLSAGYANVYAGATTLVSGFGQIGQSSQMLLSGAQSLQTAIGSAQNGSQKLADGMTQLTAGSEQLAVGGRNLTEGNAQVSAGLQTLNEQTGTLASGATELQNGTQSLADGTMQLVENGSLLVEGTGQLTNGAVKISDGSRQLADGSEQLNAGLTTLLSGTDELSSKLFDGSNALNEVDANENTYAMMAEPVIANQIETAPVVNNGTGMAPYMMSVALFVGAISLNLMYDSFTPRKYPKNGISWWASKISVLAAVGVCQALIMVGLLLSVNGLAPSSIGKMLLVTILTALVSVSIVMLFNLLFDKVGSFLMLIFLILQLSGSGGTYPIQLSNSFFEAIHPYLPMTYSIDAYRQLFGIGGSLSTDLFILLAILIVFNLLIILFYKTKRNTLQQEDFEHEEKSAALEIQTA